MIHTMTKIDDLMSSIKIIRSKNGHLFSIEDIELLDQCLINLEIIKQDLTNAKETHNIWDKLQNVIKLLDMFFGLDNIIKQFFDS